jgi:NhaP-type Na+/H+ or K+/H+ antiporter
MSLLIFAIIVLIVASLIAWAVQKLPLPSPFGAIIQALILIAAAFVIGQRAGLF